ncbi:MAG: type II toxin-antitoxin system RelE/ParE family toxin [Patescibacteria group bacterium]
MFNISADKRIEQFLEKLPRENRARVNKTVQLFKDKGFLLDERYLKKLTKSIWELRPGRIRLLFGMINNEAMVVNAFVKKTQKTPKREIDLALQRLRRYV